MESYRAWAEIDLDALAHNLAAIRHRAGPGVRRMLVAKADAYGHGAVGVAHHAVRCGVAALGVGAASEALELRRSGLRVPILVLGTLVDEEMDDCLRHGIEIGLHASDRLRALEGAAQRRRTVARVHLNVDTGMGRLGVLPGRAPALMRAIAASARLELAGIMTHLSDTNGALGSEAAAQIRRFEAVLAVARAENVFPATVHAANSAAVFTDLEPRYSTVRTGVAAYGMLPPHLPGAALLRPVMSLRSPIVFLKDLPAGAPVGYGSTWRAPGPSRIATLPVGYDDGVDWRLSGRGRVLVRGRFAPIVGRVSMDYTTLDVTHIPDVTVGTVATLIGSDGEESLSIHEVAEAAGTIPHAITCSLGKRVQRLFAGGEELVEQPLPAVELPRPERPRAEPSRPGTPRVEERTP